MLEARIPRISWWRLSRQEGVVSGVPQPNFPMRPSNLETFVPEALAPWFNQRANWRVLPDVPTPAPNYSALWPTLFTPPFRAPGDLSPNAPEGSSQGGGSTTPIRAEPLTASGPGSGGKK